MCQGDCVIMTTGAWDVVNLDMESTFVVTRGPQEKVVMLELLLLTLEEIMRLEQPQRIEDKAASLTRY